MDLRERLAVFTDLGYDAIPLLSGTKNPAAVRWQRVMPGEQWATAPDGANIGIRGGGSVQAVFLDCDDLDTWQTAQRWAAGLGYMPDGDYPLIQTASGTGGISTCAWRTPSPATGDGSGATSARVNCATAPVPTWSLRGPWSMGGSMRLSPATCGSFPAWNGPTCASLADVDAGPTVRPLPQLIPRTAAALLAGQNVDRYRSRSEAEAALITALVNAGHDFGSVLALFQLHPCAGKYAELRQSGRRPGGAALAAAHV